MDYSNIYKKNIVKKLLPHFCAFLFCVMFAYFFRGYICDRELATVKKSTGADFAPFEVESAIMFSYINDIADGKGIPDHDPRLLSSKGYKVSEQMSLGLEYFLGWGLKLRRFFVRSETPVKDYENNPAESDFIIRQLRLWVCLIPGIIYLWLISMNCPWHLALLGALLCSVSPASVTRYTGQQLLKGAFALPFIAAALASFSLAFRRKGILPLLLIMVSVFCATAFWDASQLMLGIWAGIEILRWAIYGSDERRGYAFTAAYAALILSAIIVPYNRAHYSIMSPALLVIWPSLTILHYTEFKNSRKRFLAAFVVAGSLTILHTLIAHDSHFSKNYSHFSSLAKAKIKYMNVKPADPSKLSFEQRVLWTPSLHSSTWEITMNLFPYAFWMFLLFTIMGLCFRKPRKEIVDKLKYSLVPLGVTIIFFIFHIFFVRFHVFSALALNVAFVLTAWCWYSAWSNKYSKATVYCITALIILMEGIHCLKLSRDYSDQYLRETADLLKWFRKANVQDKAFLADMEISPLLKAYCGTKILIQPKFELAEIRYNFHEYVNLMFHATERNFADYCVRNNIDFVLFTRGKVAPMHKFSYRYMADAKRIRRRCVAFLMEGYPRSMRYFYELVPPKELNDINKRYRVFKVIRPDKQATASYAAELALDYYYTGKTKLAQKLARTAFLTNPKTKKTYLSYYKVFGHIPQPTLKTFCRFIKDKDNKKRLTKGIER